MSKKNKHNRNDVVVQATLTKEQAGSLSDRRIKSNIFRASGFEVELTKPSEFFKDFTEPVESRLHTWMEEVRKKSEEMLDTTNRSKIVEINGKGQWRWRIVETSAELREILKEDEKHYQNYMRLRENATQDMIKSREDWFGGFGFDSQSLGTQPGFPERAEFTPLIGTPFYKQMYLYDYWLMHSKCFWYKNYSSIAKFVVDTTRNFVLGKGFSVSFKDKECQDIWDKYEEVSGIQEEARRWCDELTTFGEVMLKKVPSVLGISYRSIDPSTIWEIVTDPENIMDIKYYHQQYNTQYQLYGTKDAPISKYIINQLPPKMVMHHKVNVTSYEKRGRSDLLAPLLYFKYYEDYMMSRLARAKNEAAFIWDVSIDGSDEDVSNYINTTESIVDVPPGSENVHNKAIERNAISPTFSATGVDSVAQDILSIVAMGVTIPTNYMGVANIGSTGTRAGAIVATEPVAKKMLERQLKFESMLRPIVREVLLFSGKNPLDPKYAFEINFPELAEGDKSKKIQDLSLAKQEGAISHRRMSEIMAKELNISKYDYEKEQEEIQGEQKEMAANSQLFNMGDGEDEENPENLTKDDNSPENKARSDKEVSKVKKQGSKL